MEEREIRKALRTYAEELRKTAGKKGRQIEAVRNVHVGLNHLLQRMADKKAFGVVQSILFVFGLHSFLLREEGGVHSRAGGRPGGYSPGTWLTIRVFVPFKKE